MYFLDLSLDNRDINQRWRVLTTQEIKTICTRRLLKEKSVLENYIVEDKRYSRGCAEKGKGY
jgi:hypothetical protein